MAKQKSEHERIMDLESQVAELCEQLATMQPQAANSVTTPNYNISLRQAHHVCLPTLDDRGIAAGRDLFKAVGRIGKENISFDMAGQIGIYHAMFAASTTCSVWTAEWDKIIDEAQRRVSQGADDVVRFIRAAMRRAGFPRWAEDALSAILDALLALTGETALNDGLELARAAGKLGLLTRCYWPF